MGISPLHAVWHADTYQKRLLPGEEESFARHLVSRLHPDDAIATVEFERKVMEDHPFVR